MGYPLRKFEAWPLLPFHGAVRPTPTSSLGRKPQMPSPLDHPAGGTSYGHRRSGHGRVQPVAPDRAVGAQQPHEPACLDAKTRAQQPRPEQHRERGRQQEERLSDATQKQQVRPQGEGGDGMKVEQGSRARSSKGFVFLPYPKGPHGEYFQSKLKLVRLMHFLKMGSSSLLPGATDPRHLKTRPGDSLLRALHKIKYNCSEGGGKVLASSGWGQVRVPRASTEGIRGEFTES